MLAVERMHVKDTYFMRRFLSRLQLDNKLKKNNNKKTTQLQHARISHESLCTADTAERLTAARHQLLKAKCVENRLGSHCTTDSLQNISTMTSMQSGSVINFLTYRLRWPVDQKHPLAHVLKNKIIKWVLFSKFSFIDR